jgi:pilus assembly protein CpaB
MNRNRMLIIAFVALALSGLVAWAGYRVLQKRLNPPEATVQIVVAGDKLALGTRLTEELMRTADWPAANPLTGSFSDPKDLVGRGVIVPMGPNEPILESKLAPREAGAGLTSAIPEGMRAQSVNVNAVIGVAGFVGPGSRVDVIITGNAPNERGMASKVFLENVQVLAAGQNVAQDQEGKPQNVQVVTLLVTPEQSEKLALASSQGRIQLSLRNPMDSEVTNPAMALVPHLYGESSAPPATEQSRPVVVRSAPRRTPRPQPVKPAAGPESEPKVTKYEVEMIKGDKRETKVFEKTEKKGQ